MTFGNLDWGDSKTADYDITITDNDSSGDAVKWIWTQTDDYTVPLDSGTPLSTTSWGLSNKELLTDKEIIMLRALIKLLIDMDLYDTLMEKLEMDTDAAIATAIRDKGK